MQFIIIGNPENRRVQMFNQAVSNYNGLNAVVVSWVDIIKNFNNFTKHLSSNSAVRIESPGENFEVDKLLIALGYDKNKPEMSVLPNKALNLLFEKGRILYTNQWYNGFSNILDKIDNACFQKQARLMNTVSDIKLMFDKRKTHKYLNDNLVPVPKSIDNVSSFEDLINKMDQNKINRVFVKPAAGSSASGVVALEKSKSKIQAKTSVELVKENNETKLFNSLRVRKYSGYNEIKLIIDSLCADEVHVEKWIPKSCVNQNSYDIRILAVNKKPCHRIVRMGKSPMTNLHLGNKRYDFNSLGLNKDLILKIENTIIKTASLFPLSLYSGIDLALVKGSKRPVVFEVNAFGDLLPNLLWKGRSTYELELDEFISNIKSNK